MAWPAHTRSNARVCALLARRWRSTARTLGRDVARDTGRFAGHNVSRYIAGYAARQLACAAASLWFGLMGLGLPGSAKAGTVPPPDRAVALAPHIVELVFAAGAGHTLVGVVQGSDYPEAARSIANVGDGTRLNAERLLSLAPDVVIGWQPAPLRSLLPLLAAQHIDVVYSDPQRLDEIARDIARLGTVLGTRDIALAHAASLAARVQALRDRYQGAPPVRVFVQVGQDPLYSLGETSIVSDALKICGGVNVMGPSGLAAPRTSVEGVLATQPDVILAGVSSEPERAMLTTFWRARGWPAMPADSGHRIITLDADALYRATPRMIDATEQLCLRLDQVRAMMTDTQKRNGTLTHDP